MEVLLSSLFLVVIQLSMVIISIVVMDLWRLVMFSSSLVVVAMAAMVVVDVVFNVIIVASLGIFKGIVLNVNVSKAMVVSSSKSKSSSSRLILS